MSGGVLIPMRRMIPSVLIKIYGLALRKEWHRITTEDLCEVERKLHAEAYYLRVKAESLNQKQIMLKEVLDGIIANRTTAGI